MFPAILVCVACLAAEPAAAQTRDLRARRVTWPFTRKPERRWPRSGRPCAHGTLVRGARSRLRTTQAPGDRDLDRPGSHHGPRTAGPGRVPRPMAVARGDFRELESDETDSAAWPNTIAGAPAWETPPTLTGRSPSGASSKDFEPEATAHLMMVTQLDPGREAAWKRLGYKKQGRALGHALQLAAEKTEAEAQKKADKRWNAPGQATEPDWTTSRSRPA